MNDNSRLDFHFNGHPSVIPVRIDENTSPRDINIPSKWTKHRAFKVGKFNLSIKDDEDKYCAIMTEIISGRFKLVWIERSVIKDEEAKTTTIVIDMEYYEQEYIQKS